MSERREHLMGRVQYNPDVFKQTTIAALLDDFRRLAAVAGAHPENCVSDLLTEATIQEKTDGS
jgi:hypothetical protein